MNIFELFNSFSSQPTFYALFTAQKFVQRVVSLSGHYP